MTPTSRAIVFSIVLVVAAICVLPAALPLIGFVFLPYIAIFGSFLFFLLIWITFRRR
jgi:hypothetical protein